MIGKNNTDGFCNIQDGVKFKTLVYGDKTHMIKAILKKGIVLEHSHPNEQTGYLLEGHFRLTFNNENYDIGPGVSWNIPGNVKHRVEMLADCTLIEVFSPIREDYLKLEKN